LVTQLLISYTLPRTVTHRLFSVLCSATSSHVYVFPPAAAAVAATVAAAVATDSVLLMGESSTRREEAEFLRLKRLRKKPGEGREGGREGREGGREGGMGESRC